MHLILGLAHMKIVTNIISGKVKIGNIPYDILMRV